jgi:hypothetical protein
VIGVLLEKPNIFLVGAPKCGTTSIAAWLSDHPQVFMSSPKELDFFDTDIEHGYRDTLDRYERYFAGKAAGHVYSGEASTGYLRSRIAVRNILDYSPNARFIVGLRSPVELAVAWHWHGVMAGWESEQDFGRAWSLQDVRRRGLSLPRSCPDVERLLYGDVCKLGEQMQRLYSLVPRDRVFVYTLDELSAAPSALCLGLCEFLGLPNDGLKRLPVLNRAVTLPHWMRGLGRAVYVAKRRIGVPRVGFGLVSLLSRRTARAPKKNVAPALRLEVLEHFREDLSVLSSLIRRDLTGWCT